MVYLGVGRKIAAVDFLFLWCRWKLFWVLSPYFYYRSNIWIDECLLLNHTDNGNTDLDEINEK